MTYQDLTKERQRILFRAAADLYKLAQRIDGSQSWVDYTEKLGRKVEDLGHEEAVASTRDERRLSRLRAGVMTTESLELKERVIATLGGGA